jgi:flagellar hook-associated protein 2
MAGLSSPGIGSGLDVNTLVSRLMQFERQPLTRMQAQQTRLQTQISALGQFSSSIASVQDAAAALGRVDFSAVRVNSSDSSVATASASGRVASGSFSVEVLTLARAEKWASSAFTSSNSVVGSGAGTLTFEFGDTGIDGTTFSANPEASTRSVVIADGQNTLSGIRDAVNAANIGVRASIINDSSGARLVFTSANTGVNNGLRITGSGGLAGFPNLASLSRIERGQDASAKVDGLSISSPNNTLTNVVDGINVTLVKVGTTTISGSQDFSAARSALDAFAKSYNALKSFVDQVAAVNPGPAADGPLANDSSVRGVMNRLRAELNQTVPFLSSEVNSLSRVGITFQRDGTLRFDAAAFDRAVAADPQAVARVFGNGGQASSNQVSGITTTDRTRTGTFALSLVTPATQGRLTGSVTTAPPSIDASNNALSVTVNGVTASITLANSTGKTLAQLATEIQTGLNTSESFGSAGIRVLVDTSAPGNALSIRTVAYGSANTVAASGTAATALFGTMSSTAGVDAVVTLGGDTLTGTGRRIAREDGLSFDVNAETAGNLGNLSVSQGMGPRLAALLGQFNGADGLVRARVDGLNASVRATQAQQDSFNKRLEQIEARYRRQFAALDSMVASMNTTSQYLSQQLAILNRKNS